MADSKKVRILSLDGGGIRGIIPATIVAYIEQQLKKEKGEEASIADYFDMIVGTSTGGILACYYLSPTEPGSGKPKFQAADAVAFYSKYGYSIFNESKRAGWFGLRQLFNATRYNPTELEKIIFQMFGDSMLHDLLKPCTLTTYNLDHKKAFFLRSGDHTTRDRTFKVKDAIRSTSAAPTYFPPAYIQNHAPKSEDKHRFMHNIDGGVFANNPTICAYAEARNMSFPDRGVDNPSAKDMWILSIGTGGGNFALNNIPESKSWSVLKWAKSIPDIMMDGSIDTADYQMKQIFETLEQQHQHNYLRVDVPQDARIYDADMANADAKNIEALKVAGQKTLEAYKVQLDNFIKGLL